jgi:hypothetical protein
MMIALHAEPALMNVRLKQYPKAIFIKLTPIFAPIVVLVPMYARLKQFIRLNKKMKIKVPETGLFYLYSFLFSLQKQNGLE